MSEWAYLKVKRRVSDLLSYAALDFLVCLDVIRPDTNVWAL